MGVADTMSVPLSLILSVRTLARSRLALHALGVPVPLQLQVLQRSRSRRLRLANPDCAVRHWIAGRKRHEFGTPGLETAQMRKPEGRNAQSRESL